MRKKHNERNAGRHAKSEDVKLRHKVQVRLDDELLQVYKSLGQPGDWIRAKLKDYQSGK